MRETPGRSIVEEIHQTRPFASLAQEVTVALLRTTDGVRRELARVVACEGITLQQYNVLRILRGARGEPLSAQDIAERLIEQTPGVSRLIDRLVDKKLVRRARGNNDRRRIECLPTPQALKLLAKLDAAVTRADEHVLAGLSTDELMALNQLLRQVRGATK